MYAPGQSLDPSRASALKSFYIVIMPLFYLSFFKNFKQKQISGKIWKDEDFKFCICEWIKEGGGGGWYFFIPYTAPTEMIIFYDCVEQYPFVAKGSYDSFYLTPSLLKALTLHVKLL